MTSTGNSVALGIKQRCLSPESERGNSIHGLARDAMLLRVFIGQDAKFHRSPLYEAIVLKAREAHLAGATVLRGPMGFGHSSRLHITKILRLSEDLPLVIQIVDTEEKINAFLPVLDSMMPSGLVTLEKVQSLALRRRGQTCPRVTEAKREDVTLTAPLSRAKLDSHQSGARSLR